MNQRGRPLRFLGVVLGGWVAVRIAILWPSIETPADALRAIVPHTIAAPAPASAPVSLPARSVATAAVVRGMPGPAPTIAIGRQEQAFDSRRRQRIALAMLGLVQYGAPVTVGGDAAAIRSGDGFGAPASVAGASPPAARPVASRWFGGGWMLLRDDGGRAATGGPLLGAGQAGARIGYRIAPRLAVVGRLAAPLSGRGREAAAGVEWQPTRLPLRLVAEARAPIDRGGGPVAPVIGAIGGATLPLAGGFALDGYAQGGAIARGGVSGFVDAIARATRPVARRLTLGGAAWGSAQRGAARLDVGPTIGVALPVADRTVRAALDWRQRIAGDARPGPGPALTVGVDF